MIKREKIPHLFAKSDISPETIVYLVRQGIEFEHIKLESHDAAKLNTLDSYTKIMEGERFISLLLTTSM